MELILYLEPTTKSFVDCVGSITNSAGNICKTTAMKYHCHISMTGFFRASDTHQLHAIIASLDRILKSHNARASALSNQPAPIVDRTPILVRKKSDLPGHLTTVSSSEQKSVDDMPVHLLLPVSVPSAYHTIVNQFVSEFNEVRPKAINHISLAYWDEPEASEAEVAAWCCAILEDNLMDRLYDLAKENLKECPLPDEWDIVLYQRMYKSNEVGVPHAFFERERWRAAPL